MSKQISKNEENSGVLNLYKQAGETPLECLNRFRTSHPQYAEATLSYVGRLDPLASGVLLVVVNEENKNRHAYLSLSKEYEVKVLLGFETDTYDVLGLINDYTQGYLVPDEETIKKTLNDFIGITSLSYPPYSSKPLNGKPLFAHAKEGNLDALQIPKTELNISSILYKGINTVSKQDLQKNIIEATSLVYGDFRQESIAEKWNTYFASSSLDNYSVISIRVQCESGSYMRSLALEIGKKLSVSALALQIVRTKVADYCIKDSIR